MRAGRAKKISRKKNGFSNRQKTTTFIPPLTVVNKVAEYEGDFTFKDGDVAIVKLHPVVRERFRRKRFLFIPLGKKKIVYQEDLFVAVGVSRRGGVR